MSYHEYQTRSGGVTHRHNNGIRLGARRPSPWDTAELRMTGDDSIYWERRAKWAEAQFMIDLAIPDELANDFTDRFNRVARNLTWKQIFYTWRVATWSARLGACTLVDLVRETGLVA